MAKTVRTRLRDKTAAKQRIMTAAETLFADRGYVAASVADIAQAAEVNRALLYYYFRDKRDLFAATIRDGLDELERVLAAADRAPGGPWERLEWFVRSYYELLMRRQGLARTIFREMMYGGRPRGVLVDGYDCTCMPCDGCFTAPGCEPVAREEGGEAVLVERQVGEGLVVVTSVHEYPSGKFLTSFCCGERETFF